MGRGRRYSTEPKLNWKKVFAVILAIVVLIMFISIIKNALTQGKDKGKISSVSYFALYKDNKWGVIDSSGNTVIEPSYGEMIVIPNSKKDVFLCVYDVNEQTGEYKTKALNSKNEEILSGYNNIEAIENYDKSNSVWYDSSCLKVQKDGKYGLIDFSGTALTSIEYDEIQALKGLENSILVKKDDKYGLVDSKGNIVIEPNYKEITNLGNDYKGGYITVTTDNKYGIIDYNKKQVLENKYEGIDKVTGTNWYVAKTVDGKRVVNNKAEEVISSGFDEVKEILSSDSGIIFVKDSKYGIMNEKGEVIINPEYNSLKEAANGIFIAKKNENYGIIDKKNKEKVEFKFANINYVKEAGIYIAEDKEYNAELLDNEFNKKLSGIVSDVNTEKGYMKVRVGEEYKYYNFKFEEKSSKDILTSNNLFLSKKDGKYGFLDKDGKVIVDYIYDDATEQNDYGYAAIKKDGLWGSIDHEGKVVIEPTYNLDENIVIDFIGKWHLGEDVNMNYYCEK